MFSFFIFIYCHFSEKTTFFLKNNDCIYKLYFYFLFFVFFIKNNVFLFFLFILFLFFILFLLFKEIRLYSTFFHDDFSKNKIEILCFSKNPNVFFFFHDDFSKNKTEFHFFFQKTWWKKSKFLKFKVSPRF